MRPKGSAAELEQRRRLAVRLLEQGMKAAAVARAVGTSRASVTRWRQARERGGQAALAAKPHPGRPARLTAGQRRRLVRLLLRGAGSHGYGTDLWTLKRVAEVIAANFGVQNHRGHMWYVLRWLGCSSRKPQRRASERDEQAIARWRAEDWPGMKKRAGKRPQHSCD